MPHGAIHGSRSSGIDHPGGRLVVVAATTNSDKVARIRGLVGAGTDLRPLPPEITVDEPSPDDLPPGTLEPMVRLAAAKALSASRSLGGALTIATDGGLVIPALGDRWRPETTRRFAGPGATNRQRAEALLTLAAALSGADRRVEWREAVAVARDDRVVLTAVATSGPGLLATDLGDWRDDGQGFWVPRLWRSELRPDTTPFPSTGDEHWARLAALIAPFLTGLSEAYSVDVPDTTDTGPER